MTIGLVFLFASCTKDTGIDIYEGNCQFPGTVKDYTGLGTCGLLIELDNGTTLEPLGLNSGSQQFQDGDRIKCSYTVIDTMVSACMAGQIARIDCIEHLSCDSIPTDFDPSGYIDDPLTNLVKLEVSGDCVHITVQYAGGCEFHNFDLIHIGPWCGTPPVGPTQLKLFHDSNGDACEALITRTFSYDLSRFKDNSTNSVEMNLIYNTTDGVKTKLFTYNF